MASGPGLESLVDQTISVITNDGRNIVGVLKGFDQATNIILDESHERVYSTKELKTMHLPFESAGRRSATCFGSIYNQRRQYKHCWGAR
ncbi:sm-like protein LSM8 isoform X2 [Benincasa hispida]|uniref:sm-like protein LSM8 isoform X2 n=1 Tax=Benincasa hispida TaxID=102211 RepID=UPI001900D228|nr:sm-like protein LSM8 isoform X2 [Benincasa hispida]